MTTRTQRVYDYAERINDVQKYIRNHTDEALDRRVLAQIAGFSVPHLHRIFASHERESIASYVRRVRLKRAAQKLRMGAVDITEVALAAGYHTHAAFGALYSTPHSNNSTAIALANFVPSIAGQPLTS